MTRGLTARLLLVGGLALLLCAGTFAVVLMLVSDSRRASRSLQTSNERIESANRMLALVVDLETGVRGYVVTKDPAFLAPFDHAVNALPGAEQDLLDAVAGDPRQVATARRLTDAGNTYLDWQAAQRRRTPEAAAAEIATGDGKRQVDRMRGLVSELTARANATAAAERERLDGAGSRAITLVIIGLLGIPALLIVLVFVGASTVARPLQRLAAAARRLERGELGVRVEETARAEVGELERTFNALAASLEHQRDAAEHDNAELESQGAELATAVANLEVEKERMETVHAVVAALAAEPELERLTPLILELLRTAARGDVGALYLAGERGLELREVVGLERDRLPAAPAGLTARAVAERRPVAADHGETRLRVRTLGEEIAVRHELHLPLLYSGRAIGAVTLAAVADAGFQDLEALWLMADAAAVALSNALALEAARRQAEATRAVLETAHDAYIAVDGERITAWTPQAEALFGYSEREALGARLDALLIPERWHAAYRTELTKLLAGGSTTRRFELPATAKGGRRLHVEVSVSPLRTGDGWQINAFVRDIGERVARERAREVQRAVSQALAETPAHEDVVPRVLEAIGRTLRWPVAIHWVPDSAGPRAAATWDDGAAETVAAALTDALRGEPPGRFIVPLSDTLGMFEFRQRRSGPLEPALMQALEDISALVGEVLERRRIQVETDRLKNEFFALVSHELRTPLTSIIGYVELLIEEEAGAVPPDQMRFLGVIDRNARRLQRLVGDLLFVAQVEAGTLSLERGEVDLAAVVTHAVEAARPRAQQAGVELSAETDALPPLQGDPDRLAQVVDNLVTNAVKFTPAGGTVTVRACHRDGAALIEVSDTGIGIPAADRAQVFERFYRTEIATEQSIPGIGLGLSIVQAIAAGHGGSVGVESEEGRGTTFTVELPIPIHEVTQR